MAITSNLSPEEIGLEVSLYHYLIWREQQAIDFEKHFLGGSPDANVEQPKPTTVARGIQSSKACDFIANKETIDSEEDNNVTPDPETTAAVATASDSKRSHNEESVDDQVIQGSNTNNDIAPISTRLMLLSTKYRKVRTVFAEEFPHISAMCPPTSFAPEVYKRYLEYASVVAAAAAAGTTYVRMERSYDGKKKRPMKSIVPLTRASMLQSMPRCELVGPSLRLQPSITSSRKRKKLSQHDDAEGEDVETTRGEKEEGASDGKKKKKEARAPTKRKGAASVKSEIDDGNDDIVIEREGKARRKNASARKTNLVPKVEKSTTDEEEAERDRNNQEEQKSDGVLKEKKKMPREKKQRKGSANRTKGENQEQFRIIPEEGEEVTLTRKRGRPRKPGNDDDFEIDPETGEMRRKPKQRERKKTNPDKPIEPSFEERIIQLEHFVKGFGHAHVAPSHDKGLAHWSRRIRDNYRQCKNNPELLRKEPVTPFQLTPERIEKLNSLDFEFKIRDITVVSWDDYFEQLVQYKAKHGHCSIPKFSKENPKLADWVRRVRGDFRRNRRLWVDQRLERLEALGFVFIPPNCKNPTFEDRVDECRDYRRQHGHLSIPRDIKNDNSITADDRSLRQWALKIRREYRRYNDGLQSYLDKKRIRSLDELGFAWTVESGKKAGCEESNNKAAIGSGVRRRGRPRKKPDDENHNSGPPAYHAGDYHAHQQYTDNFDQHDSTSAASGCGSHPVAISRGTIASKQAAIKDLLNEYNDQHRGRRHLRNSGDDDYNDVEEREGSNCSDHSDDDDDLDNQLHHHHEQAQQKPYQTDNNGPDNYRNEIEYF